MGGLRLERLGNAQMYCAPLRREEHPQHGFPRQRVAERIRLAVAAAWPQQLSGNQFTQRSEHGRRGFAGSRAQEVKRCRRPDRGCDLEQPAGRGRQALDLVDDRARQGLRQENLLPCRARPGVEHGGQLVFRRQLAQQLLREKWIAARALIQGRHERLGDGLTDRQDCPDELAKRMRVEREQIDARDEALVFPGADDAQHPGRHGLTVTIGADNQQRQLRGAAGQVGQQIEAERIGPVDVLEQQHDRPAPRIGGKQPAHCFVQAAALGGWIEWWGRTTVGQEPGDVRQQLDQFGRQRGQQLRACFLVQVTQQGAAGADEEPVGMIAVGDSCPPVDTPCVAGGSARAQLAAEPALAGTHVADDRRELSPARECGLK